MIDWVGSNSQEQRSTESWSEKDYSSLKPRKTTLTRGRVPRNTREEIHLDTTEPFGKGKGIMLDLIDDYSGWKAFCFYLKKNSLHARLCFQHFLASLPFPVQAVRVDK